MTSPSYPHKKDIAFSEIGGIQVGNHTDEVAKTGVTVFFFPNPAFGGVTVLGGGPASRETPLLEPERNRTALNALVFAGGSAFGLEAAHGVMQALENLGLGYDTGEAIVPIVVQSDIYDLTYGSAKVRPDKAAGYAACLDALSGNHPVSGNVGAGTGATFGKASTIRRAQKGGIGYAAASVGALKVGAAAVVNAYGDVFENGVKIGGMRTEDRSGFADAAAELYATSPENLFTGNTTLIAVFTNGRFSCSELKKISSMAAAGLARSISPFATMADGDTVYALSVGEDSEKCEANINVAGTLAAEVVAKAIINAVRSSEIPDSEFLSNVK